ncbi:hypothetical protein F5X99DRAFT_419458 [Biscogniauxia marginata]|nr:hypothetical protein F5X99DRAFT_419458 [Biscogniauxia marginata]
MATDSHQQQGPPYKPNDLPPITRLITDHDAAGRAVFSTALPATVPEQTIYNGAVFRLGYATDAYPARLAGGRDIAAYAGYLASPPGIAVPGGTVVRFVDMPPGSLSAMHRTVSLDYGVVIEGEVELVLDGADAPRLLRRGDLAVQRGTMHAWRNASATEWARMMYVLQACEPVEVEGGGEQIEDFSFGT